MFDIKPTKPETIKKKFKQGQLHLKTLKMDTQKCYLGKKNVNRMTSTCIAIICNKACFSLTIHLTLASFYSLPLTGTIKIHYHRQLFTQN